jgi:MFS family permease
VRGLRRQLGVIGRSGGFRLLFLGTLGSTLGTLLATIALVVDVKDRTESGPWVGLLLVAEFLPSVIVGLFFSPLLDRLSRRWTMIVADLARVAVFCALPFAGSAGAIVALAGIAGLATGFFRPASYAGLPNLVSEEDLGAANAVLQTAENVSWTMGPVLGGILVAAAGPHPAYWLNAVSFVLSAALVAGIPARLLQVARAESRGHLRDLRDGLSFVLNSRPLRAVLVVWTVALFAFAAINTTEVFLAKDSLDAGDFGYGLIFGSIGLGLAIGSFGVGAVLDRRPISFVYGSAIVLNAVAFGGAAASPNVWVAAVCCVLGGIGNGSAIVCNTLLVQRGAPDEVRGRAFTVIMSVNYIAFGAGFIAGGLLDDRYGARWVWGGSAILLGVSGALAYAMARGVASPRTAEPEPAV